MNTQTLAFALPKWSYKMIPANPYARIPTGSVHYFSGGQLKSLCKTVERAKTGWKIDYNYSTVTQYNLDRYCKVCSAMYEQKKSQVSMVDKTNVQHYIHNQRCSTCGKDCIYLSDNPIQEIRERNHIGCEKNG